MRSRTDGAVWIGTESRLVILLEPAGKDVDAGCLHLVDDRHRQAPAFAEPLVRVVANPLLVEIDHVFGHVCSWLGCGALTSSDGGRSPNSSVRLPREITNRHR